MTDLDEYLSLAEHCEGLAPRISEQARLVRNTAGECDEVAWLDVAATRLSTNREALQHALEHGILLPEFARLRAARWAAVEGEWLTVLLDTFSTLVRETDENSPLVEALFPHRRFDKLEKSNTQRSAYRAELVQRRRSGYVRRLEQGPDYPFLSALLAPLDALHERLAQLSEGSGAAESDASKAAAEQTRQAILDAGETLARTLRQARALAEAALINEPGVFQALDWDVPKRRSARPRPRPEATA